MSVWKRLQRVGKKAAKFQFTASYQEVTLDCTKNYKPGKLVIVWTRRNRRYATQAVTCNPSPQKPTTFTYLWNVPENIEMNTTLFHTGGKDHGFEEKDWTFHIEDQGEKGSSSGGGRRRILAHRSINVAEYASPTPTQNVLRVNLKISSKKIQSAALFLTLHCLLLKEGEATDEDMISLASLMSLGYPGGPPASSSGGEIDALLSQPTPAQNAGSGETRSHSASIHDDLSALTAKLKALDSDDEAGDVTPKAQRSPIRSISPTLPPTSTKTHETPVTQPQHPTPSDPPVAEGNPFEHYDERNNPFNSVSTANKSSANNTKSPAPTSTPTPTPTTRDSLTRTNGSAPAAPSAPLDLPTAGSSGQDLLTWCQEVTSGYQHVDITNMTTSFRNGMAFCAIIHHFCPDQIDLSSLRPLNVEDNNRKAFDAAARLGIPKVMEPGDMVYLKVPDKLSVMTYLHQLRTHFMRQNLLLTHAGIKASESSYTVEEEFDSSNPFAEDVTSSESPENGSAHPQPVSNHPPSTTNSMSRHEELKEKARRIIEGTRKTTNPFDSPPPPKDDGNPFNTPSNPFDTLDDSENVRAGSATPDSPVATNSPSDKSQQSPSKHRRSSVKFRRIKLHKFNQDGSVKEEVSSSGAGGDLKPKKYHRSSKTGLFSKTTKGGQQTSPVTEGRGSVLEPTDGDESPVTPPGTKYRYAIAESTHDGADTSEYVANEMLALEREQRQLDAEAARLERSIREVMESGSSQQEDMLMRKWFQLVNKKNALIRRGMQLSIIEKEHDLEKRSRLLERELRQIVTIEESRKTDALKRRENLLLKEYISIVNQRDEIVRELDEQEKAIDEDLEVDRQIEKPSRHKHRHQYDKGCALQ